MTDTLALEELSSAAVLERIARARRNGTANWLWPDIKFEDWRLAVDDIFETTKQFFAGSTNMTLACRDAAVLGVAGYTSGMGPLLGYWVERGWLSVDPTAEAVLRLHLSHGRARMGQLAFQARKTVEQLSQRGITPIVFKGMHTAFTFFDDPGLRPMSDIDLYIPPQAMAAAERVFADMGYQPIVRQIDPYACDWLPPSLRREPRTLTYVHRDDPWFFDVQGSLNRRLLTGARVRLDALLPAEGLQAWPLSPAARVLPQPLLALQLAAHFSQINKNMTILRSCEFVFVIRKDGAAGIDWESFLRGAAAIGGARYVYPALHFAERLAQGTVPQAVLAASRADAPENLRHIVARFTPAAAQPIRDHSFRARFMWAGNWRACLQQAIYELGMDRRGRPLKTKFYNLGTKFWALLRRGITA